MAAHQFFQGFFGDNPPQNNLKPPYPFNFPNYTWNTIILEIANNWSFARWLVYRHRENILKNVDEWEKTWLEFLVNNNIDIMKYEKDSDKFIEDHYKKDMGYATH
jgi:hypothetical protein